MKNFWLLSKWLWWFGWFHFTQFYFHFFHHSINQSIVFLSIFFLSFCIFSSSFFSNQLNLPGKSLFKTLFKWNEKSLHIGDWSFHYLSWFSLHSNSISMNFFVWKILSKYFGLFKLFFRLLCVCVLMTSHPPIGNKLKKIFHCQN